MKKVVKAIGVTAALAVMIPLSANAASGIVGGAAATGKVKIAHTELKERDALVVKSRFGFMEQEVLDLLKLDEQTLQSKLDAGQTLAQIAEAQGVSRDALKNALTDSFNKKLEEQKKTFADHLDGMIDSKGSAFAGKEGGFKVFVKNDFTEVAKALGITAEELKQALASDKSIADIAKEKGVDVQKVIDAQVAAMKASIQEAVKAGKISQTEADERIAELSKMAAKMVNAKGAHGNRGFGGPHERK
ncbi:hypothetical protein E5161_10665 [Cohnella pontilimi]|uniref:Uncharacterized protein n=1 Tax=Cohnella pontilimi TaxID=2564100 RepID=A0A4U0FC57_9BACL|nr:hypothetical protein [Cohnella pontilimi]TJY42443.1 hypothetical protein E5161_10665 [Cohnella pontilimi]